MDSIAILVAAGRGERMHAGRPKAFLMLGGQTLLRKAALAFEAAPSVGAIVVVAPPFEVDAARDALAGVAKLRDVVAGGPKRQDSVLEGLKRVPDGFGGVVLVHDAARPGGARAHRGGGAAARARAGPHPGPGAGGTP